MNDTFNFMVDNATLLLDKCMMPSGKVAAECIIQQVCGQYRSWQISVGIVMLIIYLLNNWLMAYLIRNHVRYKAFWDALCIVFSYRITTEGIKIDPDYLDMEKTETRLFYRNIFNGFVMLAMFMYIGVNVFMMVKM